MIMSRSSARVSFLYAAATLFAGGILTAAPASAQEPEAAKIITADSVKLSGTFYPGGKKNSPTVLMLHPIGDGKSSKNPEWKSLAEALQKANYSVLTFDFRGHGDSTSIDERNSFWKYKPNLANVRSKDKDSIDVKDYIKNDYMTILCNDIAAARAWLERRNDDSKDCNTSSLIVIGAENSATLAALWINSEWNRFKYVPPQGFVTGIIPKFVEPRPEGKDIIGAIFLTAQPNLDTKRTVSLPGVLKIACKDNAMAALFLVGKDDVKSKNYAKTVVDKIKLKEKDKENGRHRFIGPYELDTKLSGVKLLQKGLGTEKLIVEYLDSVVADRQNERVERDYNNSIYVWRAGGLQYILAKNRKGEKTLDFNSYQMFLTP
jgi:hypothetical protein